MTLTSAGNLCVGATSVLSTERLLVSGLNAGSNTILRIYNTGTTVNTTSLLSFTTNGASGNPTAAAIGGIATSTVGDMALQFITAQTVVGSVTNMQIRPNGNVIIQNGGTFTDSGERLQVTGTAKITGASSFGGDVTISTATNASLIINTTSTSSYSDIGFQENGVIKGLVQYINSACATTSRRERLELGGNLVGGLALVVDANYTTPNLLINNSGNVGINVIPNAWSTFKALQVGLTASLAGYASTTEAMLLSSNSFYDGTQFKYQINGNATSYLQISGTHRWNYAASGTAGANITFTEGMRLDANGNLCIGVTSGGDFLNIGAGTTAKAQINLASSTAPTSPNNGDIWFDGTDLKMRIGGLTKTFTLL
jgi:hypothetical protein